MTSCLFASDSLVDLLNAGEWCHPDLYRARMTLRQSQVEFTQVADGMPSVLGARIRFLGHQLYAARRVLEAPEARFILADEVGLGKTIEAGLILQQLAFRDATTSILIVVPGAMTRQWAQEMLCRFGGKKFLQMDSLRWKVCNPKQRQKYLESDRLIVSTTALLQYPDIHRTLMARSFGAVVVDEAHQHDPGGRLYPLLRALSSRTKTFLALSATPSKTEARSIAALLSLIQGVTPVAATKVASTIKEQTAIWDLLATTEKFLATGEDLDPEVTTYLAEEWEGVIQGDTIVEDAINRLRQGEVAALQQLFYYVQEYHRLDQRIIRTRRKQIDPNNQLFGIRRYEILHYDAPLSEVLLINHWAHLARCEPNNSNHHLLKAFYHRYLLSSPELLLQFLQLRLTSANSSLDASDLGELLASDPAPDEEITLIQQLLKASLMTGEREWLSPAIHLAQAWAEETRSIGCARYASIRDWLLAAADEPGGRYVVFAQDSNNAEALGVYLETQAIGFCTRRLTVSMSEANRISNSAWFEDTTSTATRVLVCDESGAEGRNFQFAEAIIHLDLPWSVSRLEQRIGRLDRLGRGRQRETLSVIPCSPSDWENALLELHTDIFRVFSASVGGLEFALPRLQQKVLSALGASSKEIEGLKPELAREIKEQLEAQDEAFELSLDSAKNLLDSSSELGRLLTEQVDLVPVHATNIWARAHGIQVSDNQDEFEYTWGEDSPLAHLQFYHQTGSGRALAGTFNRERALAHPDLHFLGPGHCWFDGLLSLIEHSNKGRITACSMDLPGNKGKLFVVLGLRFCLPIKPSLSAGIRVSVERFFPQTCSLVPLSLDSETSTLVPVTEARTISRLSEADCYAGARCLTPQELDKVAYRGRLIAALESSLHLLLEKTASERMNGERKSAKAKLEANFASRINFLRWRLITIDDELEQTRLREQLRQLREAIALPDQEEVVLDSVALVAGH